MILLLTILTKLILFTDQIATNDELVCKDLDQNTKLKGIVDRADGSKLIFKSDQLWLVNAKLTSCQRVNITNYIERDNNQIKFDSIHHYPRKYGSTNLRYIISEDRLFRQYNELKRKNDTEIYKFHTWERLSVSFEKHRVLWNGVDATFVVLNPDYDEFKKFDLFYVIKGQQLFIFGYYLFMYDQASVTDLSQRLKSPINLTQINTKLPTTVDSAYCDQKFVYLFKDHLQYRMSAAKFRISYDTVMDSNIKFRDSEIFVEKQLLGIAERIIPTIYEQLFDHLLLMIAWMRQRLSLIRILVASIHLAAMICIVLVFYKVIKVYMNIKLTPFA